MMLGCRKFHDRKHPAPSGVFCCTDCGRMICEWHRALSPVAVDGEVVLVPVCHPSCDAKAWRIE